MIHAVLVSFLKFIDFYLESDCDLYTVPSDAVRDIERAMSQEQICSYICYY